MEQLLGLLTAKTPAFIAVIILVLGIAVSSFQGCKASRFESQYNEMRADLADSSLALVRLRDSNGNLKGSLLRQNRAVDSLKALQASIQAAAAARAQISLQELARRDGRLEELERSLSTDTTLTWRNLLVSD